MARNSRFRTTTGPSSGRPRTDKKKPVKGTGEKRESFRSGEKSGGSGRPYSKGGSFPPRGDSDHAKRPFRNRPSKDKTSWRDKGPDSRPHSSGDFARRRVSNYPPAESGREGSAERSGSFKREGGRREDQKEFGRRGTKSFSKADFKRKGTVNDMDAGYTNRKSGKGFDKKEDRGGSAFGKSGYRGENRRSFVESKSERHRKSESVETTHEPEKAKGDLIRLNKFIANSGVCSRREADDLITMGLITVNGKSITELGYKVKVTDDVRYEGRRLKSEKPVYILLNKPKGYITTTDDPQERSTVMQLIQGACKERVYPVGRLDRNTSGLLLLTNDGDLTDKLTHPSYNVKKIYKAELNRPLTKADFQKILDGVRLEEGKAMVDELAIISDDGKTVGIEIHIGWNRVIRRIFEALDYEVLKLDRSVYASLDKKDLARGHWRFLRQDEIIRLKHFQ